MDDQRQDDQLEPICNSSMPIQDIESKTSRARGTIETDGQRGSGNSLLAAWHNDDDDDDDDTKFFYGNKETKLFIHDEN